MSICCSASDVSYAPEISRDSFSFLNDLDDLTQLGLKSVVKIVDFKCGKIGLFLKGLRDKFCYLYR